VRLRRVRARPAGAFSAREIERWAQMVKEAKIDPE
jgi:hypothetical protein